MKPDKVLKKNPDVVSRVIDNETILVPIFRTSKEADYIYTLNPSAAKFWDLIDGRKTLAQIKEIILKKFDTTSKQLDKEISKLLEDLKEIKVIV